MRKIGEIDTLDAGERLIAFLRSKKIMGELREADRNQQGLWIYDEDQIELAKQWYTKFIDTPQAPEFRREALKDHFEPQPSIPAGRLKTQIKSLNSESIHLTWTMLIICFAVSLLLEAPALAPFSQYLYFTPDILHGQVWRLITPIFMHAGMIHLLFNMLWLYDIGASIEREEGAKFFLFVILTSALICNTSQFFITGPLFKGMSGVVYTMVGYAWMMTKFHPRSNYALSDMLMGFMVVWIFVGVIIPGMAMANVQHMMGLIWGLIIGGVRSGFFKDFLRKKQS